MTSVLSVKEWIDEKIKKENIRYFVYDEFTFPPASSITTGAFVLPTKQKSNLKGSHHPPKHLQAFDTYLHSSAATPSPIHSSYVTTYSRSSSSSSRSSSNSSTSSLYSSASSLASSLVYADEEMVYGSQITEFCGGSSSKVRRANLAKTGLVALKIIINKNLKEEFNEVNDEFVKEFNLLREVDHHPNINRILGITEDSKYYILVLEYANEGNLRDYLKKSFISLKWNDKIQMALDITNGLKFLHSKEIIHKNLHSHNILVNNGKLLIADFGLSKLTEFVPNSMGKGCGMVEYIEPQCFNNIKYKKDKKSDIYSLGVLLWEISSGRPPFSGRQQMLLKFQIKNGLREESIVNTPSIYQQLFKKCWDGEPKSRPDIEGVYESLRRLKIYFDLPILNDDNSNFSNSFIDRLSESDDIKPRFNTERNNQLKPKTSSQLKTSLFDDLPPPYSEPNCNNLSNNHLIVPSNYQERSSSFDDLRSLHDVEVIKPIRSFDDLRSDDIKLKTISYSTRILLTSLSLRSSQSSHLNIPNNNDSSNDLTINPNSQLKTVQQSSHHNIPNNDNSFPSNNATLTNKVKEPENKSKVESGVSQLRRDKEQNKIDNTRVDHIKIPVVKSSPSIPKLITNNQQVIQLLKLTHGLFLNGYNIQPSEQAIVTEKGKLDMSLYNGQPMVYTNINDPASSMNLLNFNSDENNLINTLQSSDLCINFPIAEVIYNSNLSESFSKYTGNDEKLYKLYGHIFARKTLIGGKLFIKELNLATLTQIDLFKSYIFWAYNSAKHNIENPINDLPISYLPRINTLDGLLLDTPEKISNWFKDLYQNNVFDIISYKNLIPVTQFKNNPLTEENFEEKQPGVANFKEELSLKQWIKNVTFINLVRWIKDFHFLQGIIITKFYKMEISKKIAASFIKLPVVKSSNKSYLEIIRPTKNVEEFLINNNIFSIKDVSSFPFIRIIQPNDSSYGDYNFHVKFEQYEIHINIDHIKSSTEFEQAINDALNSMKPFKALHDVFDEYGHVFPQKIILGRSFKRNITKTDTVSNRINIKSETLESHLDKLNISYLLTRSGNIIEKDKLLDLVQNLNDDLEIIELDNITSLYEILDKEQQEKIDNIIVKYKQDNHRIIMSGITDLKDLDNNNTDHYKRINIQPSLEDENYEVIGSIISKQKNSKLEEFLLKFGLYDLNGFSAMIKTLIKTNIEIEECYILWMIIGIPSKLSVLSPRNHDLQVKYESVTLQPNQIKMKAPFSLSQEYIISVNAHHSYEPINIRLVEWSESCIRFQIRNNSNINFNIENIDDSNSFIMSDNDSDTQQELENNSSPNIETVVNNIGCNICILRSNHKTFRIDNGDEEHPEYPLDLIGYKLSEENFNKDLTFSDE
ncbi:unnamed protein product [Rhizophagus irregularis]|nr:unnamed protein product [Rhizophagus irregularis]